MGGRPNPGTPKDKRLAANKPTTKKAAITKAAAARIAVYAPTTTKKGK